MDRVWQLLDAACPDVASASAWVWSGDQSWTWTGGVAVRPDEPARDGQIYDLASLTKPLAGSVVAAALVAAGALAVTDRVVRWLPVDPRVTVWDLLCHTSGLPPWRPLYREVPPGARDALIAAAAAVPPDGPPGVVHAYSDLGFLLLLEVIERAGGARIDRQLTAAWGATGHVPDLRWGDPTAAATERCPVRGRVVRGEVHDLNAWAMGGASSHAGLFGSAEAVGRAVRHLLAPDDPVRRVLAGWWRTPAAGSHRGGWDTPTAGGSSGGLFPSDTIGHLGYTGTSVWASPFARAGAVLLTNRVHERDDDQTLAAIRALRPRFYEAVAREFGWG